VPTDDENHVRFDFFFNRAHPISRERYDDEDATEMVENRFRRSRRNRYLQDRQEMKTTNYSGMGNSNAAQDAWATETPGPIHDRSREHLATSDVHIVAARRRLLEGVAAVEEGRDPIHVIRDPERNDMSQIVVLSEVIPAEVDHRDLWKRRMQKPAATAATPARGPAGRKRSEGGKAG